MATRDFRSTLRLTFLIPLAGALTGCQPGAGVGEPPEIRESIGRKTADEGFPANTVVARLAIDPEELAAVTSSGELVAALREHLTLDLAMPLDEPLTLLARGYAGDPSGSLPGYHFGLSALGVGYEGRESLEDFTYATGVRESHGEDFPPDGDVWSELDSDDWDEEDAWQELVTALDTGLPQSSDAFAPPAEPGGLPLRVLAVHRVDASDHELVESLEGPRLELEATPTFSSASDASWEEPEGFGYDVRKLVIQLWPAR